MNSPKDLQMRYELRIAGVFYEQLRRHLFPNDNQEAAAMLLCGRHEAKGVSILLSHRLLLIPYEECKRGKDYVTWKMERVLPFLEDVAKGNFALVKIHSHPGGYARFSSTDDESDHDFFTTAFNWSESNDVHGSAIMLPGGRLIGRIFNKDLTPVMMDKISVASNSIRIWRKDAVITSDSNEFSLRTRQVLGAGTYSVLKKLKIGIVGCSGIGSPTIEQLFRLGVGSLLLIDPDKVEEKNLNRIIQASLQDAQKGRLKTEVLAEAINNAGLGTNVQMKSVNLFDSKEAIRELILCDIIFGCVDCAETRHLLNQIANFYIIPYFDMGVQIMADQQGGIESMSGTGHYIQPGLSSLLSRNLYSQARLEAEGLQRTNPEEYANRLKAGYIQNASVERPAVLPINMLISSMTIVDFLNRIHFRPFKEDGADCYARMLMDYTANCIENRTESIFEIDEDAAKFTGRGDCKPFLRMTQLGDL
jgi:hypothetical protein